MLTVLALSLGPAGPLAAQESEASSTPRGAEAHAAAALRVTPLRDGTEVMAGGELLLTRAGSLSIGASGWFLLTDHPILGDIAETDLDLRVAYGGLVVRQRALEGPTSVSVGLLLGAGNARISLVAVETEIAADNFGIIEPEVVLERSLTARLGVQARFGRRWVYGVEDLPQVAPSQLAGWSLTAGATFGAF